MQGVTTSANGSIHGAVLTPERDPTSSDMGGEWEREGLGRGLEERLETLMTPIPAKV